MSNLIPIFSLPTPNSASRDSSSGISQVVLNLAKHLPKYGYRITEDDTEAALFLPHAGSGANVNVQRVPTIAVVHGLYPTGEPHARTESWHYVMNARVIEDIRRADEVIVPSEWVADTIRRDMRFNPNVIGWGVDTDRWQPLENQGYVLWNKNRNEGVCNPDVLDQLAKALPNVQFVTTFGNPAQNVRVIGRVENDVMRELVGHAGLYLATTRETWGIATAEALSCGVPVVGYNWAGTAALIETGINGYLAEPGDIEGLITGIEYCFKHRSILSQNARVSASWWTWENTAESFAKVFDRVLNRQPSHIKVSVVIPCYNYGEYLPSAIQSVANQQTDFNFEILVANDGSTDNTIEAYHTTIDNLPINPHLANIELMTHSNHGVSYTRNIAIKHAQGEYVVCLDADDMLAPGFLQVCANALDTQRDLAIAFTGITIMGSDHVHSWPKGYNYDLQTQALNQVPSACMFKRKFWQRVGGYKQRYAPAEDARLWLDIGAIGGKAKHVTEDGLFIYRVHANSESRKRQAPDWVGDKAWIKSGQRPFASDGQPRAYSWPVRDYDRPLVSIIIPVGPNHQALVYDALDSVETQTEHRWEVILVNDTGHDLQLTPYPYVRLINTAGRVGASTARNMGIQAARGNFVVFLDADDILYPTYLRQTIATYERTGYYVYTDWDMITLEGKKESHECPDFTPQRIFEQGYFHPITCLIPTQWLRDVAGFDDTMMTWEDVDLFMKLISAGYCGTRVSEPLLLYRYTTGSLREAGYAKVDELKAFFRERYKPYIVEGKQVVCGCSGRQKQAQQNTPATSAASTDVGKHGPMVLVEYTSKAKAPAPVVGSVTRQNYGSRTPGDTFYVYVKDAAAMPTMFSAVQTIEPPKVERIAPPEPRLLQQEFA